MTTTTANTAKNQKVSELSKIVTLKLDQLTTETYVRERLNIERTIHFGILFESDPLSVTPIEVSPTNKTTEDGRMIYSITDGRHRVAGAEMVEKTKIEEIRAIIVPVKDNLEQIEKGMIANIGGSMPPTKADIIRTAKEMFYNGSTQSRVMNLLMKIYPRDAAKRYCDEARAGIRRDNLAKAKRAVADGGLTVLQAAEKYEVEVQALRAEITGIKKKKKELGVGEMKRDLSTMFRSQSQKWSNIVQRAYSSYEEGDMTKAQFKEVALQVTSSLKRQLKTIVDWVGRVDARDKEE